MSGKLTDTLHQRSHTHAVLGYVKDVNTRVAHIHRKYNYGIYNYVDLDITSELYLHR